MIGNGLYPWGHFLTTLLFGFVGKFFDHPFGEMPNIILVVDVWEVLPHAAACINYSKMSIYQHACMWNVVMCMLSKINYEKENIQMMLSFGL